MSSISFADSSATSGNSLSASCVLPDGVNLGVVVLAAGQGTRMHSPLPKVLQNILDEPMLGYVLKSAHSLLGAGAKNKIWSVVGHGAELVQKAMGHELCHFSLQKEQLGTGHALQAAWPDILRSSLTHVLVINGDTPLVEASLLGDFVMQTLARKADISFISLNLQEPGSFGRVVRNKGLVSDIVEAKDFDPEKFGYDTKEINAGIYCLKIDSIDKILPRLANNNKSSEYYITDLVGLAARDGLFVEALMYNSDQRLLGINSPRELVESEEFLRAAIVNKLLDKGVIIHNPSAMRVGPNVELEPGVELFGPSEIYGKSLVRKGAKIESHCYIKDTSIEKNAAIRSFCHMEDSVVGPNCTVGPYARLRTGSVLEEKAHIGNFVEMKKSRLGKASKAGHLSYLGDAEIGPGVNIGAGVITCNYDGKNKHKTLIGQGAFIGSNCSLVAPVSVGDEAMLGAGSVITKDVPAEALAIARGIQKNMPGRSRIIKGKQ